VKERRILSLKKAAAAGTLSVPSGEPEVGALRLDQALVARGLSASRARARDAILRGCVTVDGALVDKPAAMVTGGAVLAIDDPAAEWVSRAALKLIAGLDAFGIDPKAKVAMDLGASTGGFTQVLLARGALHVVAVEVGHGQLHDSLRADPRVTLFENLNARHLGPEHFPVPIGILVSDLSFISLTLALPPALALAAPKAEGVFLVKPQYEAGREAIGKGGIVRDPAAAAASAREVADWLNGREGWRVLGLVPSPIEGGDGNVEFLLGARRG